MPDPRWRLQIAASAERSLNRLSERIAASIVEFLLGPVADNPHRLGKPLRDELTGYHAARRGPYRVVYRIDDQTRVIYVVRIDHRSDVYRLR